MSKTPFGNPKQLVRSSTQSPEVVDAGEQEENVEESPVPLETAKSKKLAISRSFQVPGVPSQAGASTSQASKSSSTSSSSESDSDEPLEESKRMKGYHPVDCESL